MFIAVYNQYGTSIGEPFPDPVSALRYLCDLAMESTGDAIGVYDPATNAVLLCYSPAYQPAYEWMRAGIRQAGYPMAEGHAFAAAACVDVFSAYRIECDTLPALTAMPKATA